jgi:hypothetical protein
LGVGLTTLPCKRENVEKPPRNSTGFCGGGQGLSWAVEPRKEEEEGVDLVGAFFLTEHHAMKAYWGSGIIAPRILDFSTRCR